MSYRKLLRKYPITLPRDGTIDDIGNLRMCGQYKYDGTDTIIIKSGNLVSIIGCKSGKNSYAPQYSEIVSHILLRLEKWDYAVIRAELTFFDDSWKDHFLSATSKPETIKKYNLQPACVAHDLIKLNGKWLVTQPYKERYNLLNEIVDTPTDKFFYPFFVCPTSWNHKARGRLFQFTKDFDREGIVLKDIFSPCSHGLTSKWLKVKNWRDGADLLVLGITSGKGSRRDTFGALLLGREEGDQHRYLGKVNVPLDEDRELLLRLLEPILSPSKIEGKVPQREVKYYVKPEVHVEINHLGITREGIYRSARFKRVRDDL